MTGRRWRTRYYPAWGLMSVPRVKGTGDRVVMGQQRSRHWLGGRLAVYW